MSTTTPRDSLRSDLALGAPRKGWTDPAIWLSLAAGPAFWLVAAAAGVDVPGPERPSWARIATVLLWYPVLEELLFRGVIQGQLIGRGWGGRRWLGISAANAVTALLFAALHLALGPTPWAAAVVVPALVFGGLRERTASVYPAILVHAGYNASLLGAGALTG